MKRTFLHSAHQHGTTLIEVLAGLVILSTLLVSLAMARGRFLQQWKDADRRLTAVKEADHLLEQWMALPPQAVPVSAQGSMDEQSHHVWRTQVIPSLNAASLGTIVVRLQVFESSVDETSLTKVDFLLRDPRLSSNSK